MHPVPRKPDSSVTLVLGGVRSGKSRYAQQLAESARRVTFIATAEARGDAEMHHKIARHQADRPATWTTIEEPLHLSRTLHEFGASSDLILIDCLTLFAANLLEACGHDDTAVQQHCTSLLAALSTAAAPIVLVSNEVGSGVVPAHPLGRRFRDLLGEVNQRVAALADTVILMIAGLPLTLKSPAPAELRP